MTLQVPHNRCYWVEPGQILAGSYPGAPTPEEAKTKIAGILDAGVRCFINLMEKDEVDWQGNLFLPYKDIANDLAAERGIFIKHIRIPIPDQGIPMGDELNRIQDVIDLSLMQELPVYVHCWGGHGRTGMAVGCYLIRNNRATGQDFVEAIKELRKDVPVSNPSPENGLQIGAVQSYELQQRMPKQEDLPEDYDRYLGCLMGLAVGDAVGTTLEFTQPGRFEPITDMVGGGPFSLNPGEWTDDTIMALCLAESLIERWGFDPKDQLRRYVRWVHEGYLSAKGRCFDIGGTTLTAITHFEKTGDAASGPTEPRSAGNGSLMRLAPVPMAFANKPADAMANAAISSKTTHGAMECVDACRYYAGLLVGALQGVDKETLLSPIYCPIEGYWERHLLAPKIHEVAAGSFKDKEPPEIQGRGYVVLALEAALWAFYKTDNYRDGCLLAANLGDDADTTAAIYGQIAGAYYGVQSIPKEWRDKLHRKEQIEEYAMRLYKRANPKDKGFEY